MSWTVLRLKLTVTVELGPTVVVRLPFSILKSCWGEPLIIR